MAKIVTILILILQSYSAKANAIDCRLALGPSIVDHLLKTREKKGRELTEFEIEAALEVEIRPLMRETERLSAAFKDNPEAVTLLQEIALINVGTSSVLAKAQSLSKLIS